MEQTKIYQTMMRLLSRHTRPDEKLMRALHPLVKQRAYEAKDIFISKGEIPTRIGYLSEGAAIAYKHVQGQRQLVSIWKDDEMLMHIASALKPHKSEVDIVFPCHSQVMEINIKELYRFRDEHPEITPYLGHFLRSEITRLTDHICWLKTTKAEERIRDFQKEYKLHNMLLPDEHKAQFLNMSLRWYQAKKYITIFSVLSDIWYNFALSIW